MSRYLKSWSIIMINNSQMFILYGGKIFNSLSKTWVNTRSSLTKLILFFCCKLFKYFFLNSFVWSQNTTWKTFSTLTFTWNNDLGSRSFDTPVPYTGTIFYKHHNPFNSLHMFLGFGPSKIQVNTKIHHSDLPYKKGFRP